MSSRKGSGILSLVLSISLMGLAHAETKTCDAVDKSAQATANSAISVSGDKQAKTCSFSVGGATSSSADVAIAKRLRDFARADAVQHLQNFPNYESALQIATAFLVGTNTKSLVLEHLNSAEVVIS